MDTIEATSLAECLEMRLGSGAENARVECFAVPLTPCSTRRRTRWAYLVVTDLEEREVREGLSDMDVELIERRGSTRVLVGWP